MHIQGEHGDVGSEAPRGQVAVSAADYGLLPQILNAPDVIEPDGSSDVGRSVIRIIKTIAGRRYTAVFELRTKRKMLALQSLRIAGK